MANEIDQRAQRRDPASTKTYDSNDGTDPWAKQSGQANPTRDDIDQKAPNSGVGQKE